VGTVAEHEFAAHLTREPIGDLLLQHGLDDRLSPLEVGARSIDISAFAKESVSA
jgi:hypothetical protein